MLLMFLNDELDDDDDDDDAVSSPCESPQQQLPNGYQRLPTAAKDFQRLSTAANGYQRLSTAINGCQRLSTAVNGCQRLQKGTSTAAVIIIQLQNLPCTNSSLLSSLSSSSTTSNDDLKALPWGCVVIDLTADTYSKTVY